MQPGPHLAMLYDYVPDIVERRAPHREDHLARIRRGTESGAIVMAGALGDPPTGALIIFAGEDAGAAAAWAEEDPYVRAGLVTGRRVLRWNVVAAVDG